MHFKACTCFIVPTTGRCAALEQRILAAEEPVASWMAAQEGEACVPNNGGL